MATKISSLLAASMALSGQVALRIAATVSAAALCAAAQGATLHLAPDGRDEAEGTSRGEAVRSMTRAWELAGKQPKDGVVTIMVHPGTYRGQALLIDGSRPNPKVTWKGQRENGQGPVFVGDARRPTWLRLKASDGQPTGLTIEGVEVREYLTAISLEGNRDDPRASNEGTVIRNNVFRRIGTIAVNDPQKDVSAAVRFVNSHNNVVSGNRFLTIRNVARCGALHAVYVAHFSSGNQIVDNEFEDLCGSVIRFRDRSNDNLVRGNRFRRVEQSPAIEEWFCDKVEKKNCTKQLGECPSTGNISEGNELVDSTKAEKLSIIGPTTPRPWCNPKDYQRNRVEAK